MTITPALLARLKAPFPENHIFVRVLELNEEGTRAMLVKYLRHTDVATRLDEIDPAWSTEIIRSGMSEPATNRIIYTQMKLTIMGVSRENVGEGQDPKASASDALKRCAMSFGVGRYLCDAEEVWVDYDDTTDHGREWTLTDYERGLAGDSLPAKLPSPAPVVKPKAAPVKPKVASPVKPKQLPSTIAALGKELRRCQDLLRISEVNLLSWARESAGVSADKMDVPQLQQFVGEMHIEMRKAKIPV